MNEVVPATAAPGAPGPQLKAEREKRGMSVQKAADELHLDPWVIEALESGDYPRIGPTVYAKGHLKRYAGLLGLPAAAIMAGYEARGTPAQAVTLTSQSARMASAAEEPALSNLSPGRIVGIAAVAVVLLGVLWWQPWHQRGKGSAPSDAAVNGPAASATPDPSPLVSEPAQAIEAPTVAASVPAAAPVSEANPGTLPGAGRARLRLSFSADSWVDVHDANGRRAFSGNGLANSVKTITGTAPMHVYLGAANGVALEINDRTVVIGRQFFAGNVARFEAGADGVLRPDAPARPARPRG